MASSTDLLRKEINMKIVNLLYVIIILCFVSCDSKTDEPIGQVKMDSKKLNNTINGNANRDAIDIKYIKVWDSEDNEIYRIIDSENIVAILELLASMKTIDANELGEIIPAMVIMIYMENDVLDSRCSLYENQYGSEEISTETISLLRSFRKICENADFKDMERKSLKTNPKKYSEYLLQLK